MYTMLTKSKDVHSVPNRWLLELSYVVSSADRRCVSFAFPFKEPPL